MLGMTGLCAIAAACNLLLNGLGAEAAGMGGKAADTDGEADGACGKAVGDFGTAAGSAGNRAGVLPSSLLKPPVKASPLSISTRLTRG